ncbi:hypothetical protein [Ralstonia holmesii]|uniref:hypothetical protein n=1 Tax=Ralstonia holmesii TaxID=3058602 RepID=UPI0029317816|nr:hypothetical protein [Ralstonia sp. LMG 32967]
MVCLIAIAVILLAVGVCWWGFRQDKLRQLPTRPPETAWRPDPSSFDPYGDEWESLAPYPEHATRAMHHARPLGQAGRAFHHPQGAASLDASHVIRDQHDSLDSWAESQHDTAPTPSPPASDVSGNSSQVHCPHCQSYRIETLNIARKAGSTIGSVAGATSGMAMAMSGAEVGATVGAVGGPLGSIFGGLAGAVIAGLVGSAAGCAAGSAVGAAIDDNVLDNYLCRSCGYAFNVNQE